MLDRHNKTAAFWTAGDQLSHMQSGVAICQHRGDSKLFHEPFRPIRGISSEAYRRTRKFVKIESITLGIRQQCGGRFRRNHMDLPAYCGKPSALAKRYPRDPARETCEW